MKKDYYYFVSSLPMIDFESKPPMTQADFLAECEKLLTPGDYALAQAVISESGAPVDTDDEAVKKIAAFNRDHRNEIAAFRAEKAHKDPLAFVREIKSVEPGTVEVIHQAAKESNLLKAQKTVDRYRWDRWEEFTLGRHFDLSILIVYGLKLEILERYQDLDSSKGKELLDEYTNINLEEHISVKT